MPTSCGTPVRLLLPGLPADPAGSHGGTWEATLRLRDPQEVLKELQERGDDEAIAAFLRALREAARRPVPYNLSVHTYSNLRLQAAVMQDSFAPGAVATLVASLYEYDLPFTAGAKIWAEVRFPDGSVAQVGLGELGDGRFGTDVPLKLPGQYRFVVHAVGTSRSNGAFTRDKVLTAGVWEGGDRPWDPRPDGRERLEHGDLGRLREIARLMEEPAGPDVEDAAAARALVSDLVEQARTATPPLSTPVTRRPKRDGVPGNLFVTDPEPIESHDES